MMFKNFEFIISTLNKDLVIALLREHSEYFVLIKVIIELYSLLYQI